MQVEIWSDVVCPWCAVGRARFEKALAAFPHREEVDVRWRSFELDPQSHPDADGSDDRDGRDIADHLAAKYGMSRERAVAMNEQMTQTAAAEGLEFHFEKAKRGNTFDAHRLLHLAADRGVQDAVKGRLFRAYFGEGALISDHETLVRLGAEAGLDADEARAVLAGDRYAGEVRADEAQARAFGISGVPFFVIDRKYGISGAQPSDAVLEALTTAWTEAHPLQVLTPGSAGDACADGSCAI